MRFAPLALCLKNHIEYCLFCRHRIICVTVSPQSMFIALDLKKKEKAGLRQEINMSLLVKGISCCSASNGLSTTAIPCCSIIHGWSPDESQHDGMVALETRGWKRKRSHASRVSCLRGGPVSNLRFPEALHACLPLCNEIVLPAGPLYKHLTHIWDTWK